MRILVLSIVTLFSVVASVHASVSFKASVDNLKVAYEEKIQLRLEVSVSDPAIKTTPLLPPEIIGLKIGGSGSSVERQGDLLVRRYTYELVPGRSGEVTIPSFKLEYQEGETVDTLLSEPISVEIAEPIKPSGPVHPAIKFGIPSGLIVILAALAVRRRRKLAKARPVEVDWRDDYRNRFAELKKIADRQDFREFSREVMKLIVSILERIYETKISGFTSSDILRWLEEKTAARIVELLLK